MSRESAPSQLRYDHTEGVVSGLLVPYGVVTVALNSESGKQVREVIEKGAMQIVDSIKLNLQHTGHIVAENVDVTEAGDGVHIRAHLDGVTADLATRYLHRGMLTGLSAEFDDIERVEIDGIEHVRKAILRGAALVDRGAYPQAVPQLRELHRARRVSRLQWL